MKRIGLITVLIAFMLKFASGQTINVSGTVKTADGDALHLAFVQDKQFKNGAYTDSSGNFSLTVSPNSKLKVGCKGFRDTLININNQTTFAIVLRPAVNIVASRSNITPEADDHNDINFEAFSGGTKHNDEASKPLADKYGLVQGAIFPVFIHKEATQGSRYLFNTWVHGYVINARDSMIQNPALFFNYDKMDGSLLLTKDRHSAIAVYKENIKSFTLFNDLNQPSTFTMVPEIDKTHYVQVIASGNNYNVYKAVTTRFIQSNYKNDGVASTGNNFDLYQDDFTYYVLNVKTSQLQKVSLRKKVLKQAFGGDESKADTYFKANNGDIDDNYLASLSDYMNK